MNTRHAAAITAVCSAALLAPLVRPLLVGRVFIYNDLSAFHLPMRYLYQQALRAGDSLLWTPSIFSGFFLHGEGQVGLLHPFHLLLYWLLPLGVGLDLELIANYPLAFGGMVWLLTRLRFSAAAALFGAMLFAFSGFNLLHHHHVNMVAVVAHLPWLLAACDVLLADERARTRWLAACGIAAIVASELLLGFPQAVLWNMIALAAFAVFRADEIGEWRRVAGCGAGVLVGILLGCVQLIPTADLAAHSVRSGVPRDFALSYSLHPYNLLQIWSPYFFARGAYSATDYMWFHEFGIYSGAILPIALIWVWIRRRALAERRRLIVAASLFAGVMLVLALGRYGGVAVLLTYLPVLGSLRAPVRYIVLAQFALAVLAAVALDDLLAIAERRRDPQAGRTAALWIPAALGIATTLALNTGLLRLGPRTFGSVGAASAGVAIVIATTVAVFLAGRRVRWAIPALILITAADLAAWGLSFVFREPPRTLTALTQAIEAPPERLADRYAVAPNDGPLRGDLLVVRGYRLTSGYVGLFPSSRYWLEGEIARRLSGTRWVFTNEGARRPFEGAVDRVRLLDAHGQPASGRVQLTIDRPGYLVAHVDAPGPRVVALTERFYEGWTATLDGAPSEPVRIEQDFLGCAVTGGIHRVTLRFRPRSMRYGEIASGLGAVLFAGMIVAALRARPG